MTTDRFSEELARLAREVIASYEARVASVEQLVEVSHEMLEAFRSQREAMRGQLRETLARAASLRKRDFDAMMQGILARQEASEQAVRESVRSYLQEQRELAAALKETLAMGEGERVETVKELLGEIAARRQAREGEVRALLAELQNEQEEVVRVLGRLRFQAGSVKIKEFKTTLRAIQSGRGLHRGGDGVARKEGVA